jgi:hypothetical protein
MNLNGVLEALSRLTIIQTQQKDFRARPMYGQWAAYSLKLYCGCFMESKESASSTQITKIGNKLERSTPYWILTQRFRGASISSHLQDWIRFILENDPECKNDSGSAIKSLVELIREKCLVIMFQPKNKAEYIDHVRTSADELRQEFADIIFRAQNEVKYCFTGSSRVGVRSLWPLV